ncbi:DUF4407 domain-containing protein [Amycolatopsis sp. NPDC059657]|uniref:DUF4407 domain-containing protein n=1 Tax=Amycolatopsis sp. NPDC059657 TaxID=3346899 RepID=UPI00366B0A20
MTEPTAAVPVESAAAQTAARWLRTLTGADEKMLDEVPSERARYTAMGGVVFGTAVIATFSMLVGLSEVIDAFNVLLFVPALIWGCFILNLDRWLISSSAGTGWSRRAGVLVPRLMLACCFGVVIAEPLVLRIFAPAIEQHVLDARDQDLRNLTSLLLRCNPDPTAETAAFEAASQPECDHHRMKLEAGHAAVSGELAGLKDEAKQLRGSVDADNAEQARRDTLASNECAGTPGPGVSGKKGRGPECLTREAEAQDFRRTHPITERSARLATLETRIAGLEGTKATSQQEYQRMRDAEVKRQVDEMAANQGPIGLLQRLTALDELTSANGFLVASSWFIRGFLILVDCLPVLVKLLGGVTRYEQLVEARASSAQKIYQEEVKTKELREMSNLEVEQHELRNAASVRLAASDSDRRWQDAQREVECERHISELAEQIKRRGQEGGPFEGVPRKPLEPDEPVRTNGAVLS